MIETAIIAGVVALSGTAWGATMIMNVKEKQEVILESFGKYVKTIKNAA
jgi:regulator of protease activity HflC (stomatin/prohibitin superfamily)